MALNQNELLQRANTGDKTAYQELLAWLLMYSKQQLKWGLHQYKNFPEQSKDDIVQEVLLTFHQTHQTFDSGRPLIPWVNAIIKHKTIDFIRKKDFRVQMESFDLDLFSEIWSINDEDEQKDPQVINQMLENLNREEKAILLLAKIEGYSSKEIAKKLNLSDANVKVQIHRALKKLKSFS